MTLQESLNQLFKWFIRNYRVIQEWIKWLTLYCKSVTESIIQMIHSKLQSHPGMNQVTYFILQECHWINYLNDSFKTTESSRNESRYLLYTVRVSLNQLFKWFIRNYRVIQEWIKWLTLYCKTVTESIIQMIHLNHRVIQEWIKWLTLYCKSVTESII